MTVQQAPDLIEDEAGGTRGSPGSRRPLIAGAAAAAWALLVGIALVTCVVMLVWAVSPNSTGDSAAAWRAAGLVWLGAHQVPLELGGRTVSLMPLGAVLLGLLLTRRSGGWVGRLLPSPSTGETLSVVIGASLAYGVGGAGIAWLSGGASTSADPARAMVVTGLVAAGGTTWGIAREAGLLEGIRARSGDAGWRMLVAGVAAVCGLLGMGAALVSVSMMRHFPQVAGTLADLDAGFVGSLGLTLVGILCLPTLAIWAMAVVVGPGFDLGSVGGLSAFGGEVGVLPALPVLAAIPTTLPGWAPLLLVVPVALGVLAGRIRWGRDLPTLAGALTSGAVLGVVVGGLVAGLVLLASGSLGGGRLAAAGPEVLSVSASAAGLVVLGFLSEAGFQSMRLSWDLHRAEQRAAATLTPDPGDGDAAAEVGDAGDGVAGGRVATGAGAGADCPDVAAPGDADRPSGPAGPGAAVSEQTGSRDAGGTVGTAVLIGPEGAHGSPAGSGSPPPRGSGSPVPSSGHRIVGWVGAAGVFVSDTVMSVTGRRGTAPGEPGDVEESGEVEEPDVVSQPCHVQDPEDVSESGDVPESHDVQESEDVSDPGDGQDPDVGVSVDEDPGGFVAAVATGSDDSRGSRGPDDPDDPAEIPTSPTTH